MIGPSGLTQAAAGATGTPSDLRTGIVTAVTARGIDVQVGSGSIEGAAHLTSYSPAVGDSVVMIAYGNTWFVLGRALGPGTPTDNATPGLGLGSTILDGCVLSGSGATMVSTAAGPVAVPRYAVNYYHPLNHWVMLLWTYTWASSVAGDVVRTILTEAAAGTIGQLEHTQGAATTVGTFATVAIMAPPSLGGAERSFSMQLQRFSGTGTVRIDDAALRRGSLLVYDLGDNAMIRTV